MGQAPQAGGGGCAPIPSLGQRCQTHFGDLLEQAGSTTGLTHKQRPPRAIFWQEAVALRRPELAGMKVPAAPAGTGQLEITHHAQQLVGRIRHRNLTGHPVADGARRDVKDFPGLVGRQACIHAEYFEPFSKHGAGLWAVAGGC